MQTQPAPDAIPVKKKALPGLLTGATLGNPVITGGLILMVALSVAGYLLASSRLYGPGYPLDDAWIHQTYARNLALHGEWSFIPGQPSAGSTSPLWSVLLAVGYWLGGSHFTWAFLLGSLSLLGLCLSGEALFREFHPAFKSRLPFAGVFLAGEWHLAWAAVSGMETLLAGLCVLLALLWISRAREGRAWAQVGLLIGLSVWVRPDGITLLGPAVFTLVLAGSGWRERLRSLFWLLAGTAFLLVPYLFFNLVVQGSIWPNTFYAKQAEYASLRDLPLLVRFFNEIKLPLIGSGLFLLPGLGAFAWRTLQTRRWAALAAVIWFFGYGLLYAMRLPVTYQYGRYFIPAMPVYFVTALVGTVWLLAGLRANRLYWLLARVGVLSTAVLWLSFYVVGAGRYTQDVAIIETEMVATAKWIAANTEPGALVAVHDIGAVGYFSQRPVLDLAGLVSPQVIPFMRDEDRIANWLDEQGADYLVVLNGWYSRLPRGKTLLYQTNGRFSLESGGTNMQIYRWRP